MIEREREREREREETVKDQKTKGPLGRPK